MPDEPTPPNNPSHIGGFEIQEKIGEGGMGAVYRARQKSLDRVVALKILSQRFAADATYIDSFRREAKSAARLHHANIIPVFDAGEADGVFYYAMELVKGQTLFRWVQRESALSEKTVLEIGLCVASALKHAWDKERLIHRDVKPDNIIIDTDGNVKLCDLGLAKNFGENTMLSLSGQAFGTPQFMSPEQARADRSLDCRSDIYSLGMTLYYAFTGEIPFNGGTPTLIMARHLTEFLPDPRDYAPQLSAHAVRILEKMLAKDVNDRYANWDDVLRDIELARQNQPPQTTPLPPGKSTMRRGTSQRPMPVPVPSAPDAPTIVSKTDGKRSPEVVPNLFDGARGRSPSKKSNTPLIIGVSVAVIAIVVAAVVMLSNRNTPSPNPPTTTEQPPPIIPKPPDPQPNIEPPKPTEILVNIPWQTLRGHTAYVTGVAFSPDGKTLLTSSFDTTCRLWDWSGSKLATREFRGHKDGVWSVAFSADGSRFLSGGDDSALKMWNVASGNVLWSAQDDLPFAQAVWLGNDGVVGGGGSTRVKQGTLGVWEAGTGKLRRSFFGSTARIQCLAVTPNNFIVTGAMDGALKLWDSRNGTVLKTFRGHNDTIYGVAVSPDGKLILTGSHDQTLKLWDVATGEEVRTLNGHEASVKGVAFSPDGKFALSGSKDKTVRMWDVATGKTVRILKGSEDTVLSVAFSPDGQLVAAGGMDSTARIWKLNEGAQPNLDPERQRLADEAARLERQQRAKEAAKKALEPLEREARAVVAAHGAFEEFRKPFLASLAKRDYTDAEQKAKQAANVAALAPLREYVVGAETAASRLKRFWNDTFPDALNKWAGKPASIQGISGLARGVNNGDIIIENLQGKHRVPIAKMATNEVVAAGALTMPLQSADTMLDGAWFVFAEGQPALTQGPLEQAKLRGADIEPTQRLMRVLNQGALEEAAFQHIGKLRQAVEQKEWVEAAARASVLHTFYGKTKAVETSAKEIAELEAKIASAPDAAEMLQPFTELKAVLEKNAADDRAKRDTEEAARRAENERQAEQARLAQQKIENENAALAAFGNFQKTFLAALAKRDYAGAEQLAQNAATNPAFVSLKDKAAEFGGVAKRLNGFWSSFPTTLAALKGNAITVNGTAGKLDEVRDGNLEVEKKIGETGAAIVEVPIAKLTVEEIASLTSMAKPNDKDFFLDLAWFLFAEGKSSQAAAQLDAAEKAGADVKTQRKLIEELSLRPTEIKTQTPEPRFPRIQAPLTEEEKLKAQVVGTWKGFRPDGTELGVHRFFSDGTVIFPDSEGGLWKIESGLVYCGRMGGTLKMTVPGKEMEQARLGKNTFKKIPGSEADAELRDQIVGWWDVSSTEGVTDLQGVEFRASGGLTRALKSRSSSTTTKMGGGAWTVDSGVISMNVREGNFTWKVTGQGKIEGTYNSVKVFLKKTQEAQGDSIPASDTNTPLLRTFEGHKSEVVKVVFAPDGKYIFSASTDKTVKQWDANSGTLVVDFKIGDDWVRSVAVSADNRVMAAADWGGKIQLWDISKWPHTVFRTIQEDNVKYHLDVALSSDGKRVAAGSVDGKVRVWSTDTGRLVTTFEGHSKGVKGVEIISNNDRVLSCSEENEAKLWVLSSGREVKRYSGDSVRCVTMSRDGRYIIGGCREAIRIWDPNTGEALHQLQGHTGNVNSVAISPDGKFFLSGSDDKTVKLWELTSKPRVIKTLTGHSASVLSVAFNHDGKYAVSSSFDKTVKLWRLSDQPLVTPKAEMPSPDAETKQQLGQQLCDAAAKGDIATVQALLAKGADTNQKDGKTMMPLLWAAEIGNKELVALLLSNKADVNGKRNDSVTPLHIAAGKGFKEVAELLLVNKADVNAKDTNGKTPLYWARNKEMVILLLDNKADINAKDNHDRTPLDWVIRNHKTEIADLLRQRGAKE